VTIELLQSLDAVYDFTGSKNAEIQFRWYILCIRCGYMDAMDSAIAFITSQVGSFIYVASQYQCYFSDSAWCLDGASYLLKVRKLDSFLLFFLR